MILFMRHFKSYFFYVHIFFFSIKSENIKYRMNSLFKDLLLNTLMAYATKKTANPWDEYEELLKKPSVMDKIIDILKQESTEQKEQRIKNQRKSQRQYEKQRADRIKENKRKHGLEEEDKKEDKSNLENLKKAGRDIREHLEHGENKRESFFRFEEPVPGCKYNIGEARGDIIIPLDQADLSEHLAEIHRCVYLTVEQLFDNINKTLDIHVISLTEWLHSDSDGRLTVIPNTQRSKTYTVSARNQIMNFCDMLIQELTAKLEVPQKRSNLRFKQGVLIKLHYRSDLTKIKKESKKKNKGGSYIDHQSVQCFTSNVRKDDLKKMYNYVVGKDSYIYNIINRYDDLCFLRYIILVKYLCNVERHEYLKYEGKDSFKNYYTHKLVPKVNPDRIEFFIAYFPFINYPQARFNDEAKNIIEKHYPNMSIASALESVKANKFTREYIYACCNFMKMLNDSNMFPINADDANLIKQFEEVNGITMNIYYLDQSAYQQDCKKKLYELWSAKYMTEAKARNIKTDSHLDLMLIRKIVDYEEDKRTNMKVPVYQSHFMLLLDAIELATNQRGRNPNTLQCIKCKEHFNGRTRESTKGMLHFHYENDECVERTIRYVVPSDNKLVYTHHYTAYCKDFVIYSDFEAINKKLVDKDFVEVDEFDFNHNENITEHEVVSAQYLVLVNDSKLNLQEDHSMFGKSFLFKGSNPKAVLRAYLKSLKESCDTLNKELEFYSKIDYEQYYKQRAELNKQTHCFVCKENFEEIKLKMEMKALEKKTLKNDGSKYFKKNIVEKHLHHDHKQEKDNIIGYACQRCNMQMTEKRRAGIPVIFHNGSHYDWKFLMKEIGSIIEEELPKIEDLTKKQKFEQIEVLGLNSENYITIKWNNMWFIDSFKFMSDSLSNLVGNLTKEDMKVSNKLYALNGIKDDEDLVNGYTFEDKVSILSRKNVFPYVWFDSYDRMSATSLPERKHFKLREDKIYASVAWKVLGCKTFEEYHDMYLLADVVLLAACFHAFRRNIYNMHTTDPAYFLGLPGLSWSIAMKYLPKGKAIELLEKPEHYITFQNSLQGGICQVFQRYAKRRYEEVKSEKEEEYISNDEEPKRRSLSQILYLDVNGLYAHIMAN